MSDDIRVARQLILLCTGIDVQPADLHVSLQQLAPPSMLGWRKLLHDFENEGINRPLDHLLSYGPGANKRLTWMKVSAPDIAERLAVWRSLSGLPQWEGAHWEQIWDITSSATLGRVRKSRSRSPNTCGGMWIGFTGCGLGMDLFPECMANTLIWASRVEWSIEEQAAAFQAQTQADRSRIQVILWLTRRVCRLRDFFPLGLLRPYDTFRDGDDIEDMIAYIKHNWLEASALVPVLENIPGPIRSAPDPLNREWSLYHVYQHTTIDLVLPDPPMSQKVDILSR